MPAVAIQVGRDIIALDVVSQVGELDVEAM